jgi:hypothetical protein
VQRRRTPRSRPPARPRLQPVLATVLCAVAAFVWLAPSASAQARDPYLRALGSIDGALRFAIERQPEGLAKSLAASERICSLGQGAEERGEAGAAAADWSTLSQTVELLDEPGLTGVERALGAAIDTVDRVEATVRRAWSGQTDRVRDLRAGAKAVRAGLRRLRGSFADLRQAFSAWEAHRCEAALAAIDAFAEAVPAATVPINRGMERLWTAGWA